MAETSTAEPATGARAVDGVTRSTALARHARTHPVDLIDEHSSEQLSEMGSRGSLEVQDKAVGRIAEAAVLEVPGVAPAADTAGTLGTALGRTYPRVDCHVAGRRVHVHVEVVTHWPQPAARIAAAVRDHVAERLRTLADLDVDAVEVHVAKVIRPTTPERRRVQ